MRPLLLLLAVLAAIVAEATYLTKGADLVVNPGYTSDIATVALDATSALMCYNDVANRQFGTCSVLALSGTSVSQQGPDLIVNAAPSSYLAVAAFGSHSAAVCYHDVQGTKLGCRALVRTGNSLRAGREFAVKGNAVEHISLGALDGAFAILCYSDMANTNFGTCNVIGLNMDDLYEGPDFLLNQGYTDSLVVVPHSGTTALACFVDKTPSGGSSDGWFGACIPLIRSGTVLSSGGALEVTRGSAWSISAAPLDSTKSVVCFQDGSNKNGVCRLLTLTGTTLSQGSEVQVNAGATYHPRVAALGSTTAVMCYEDRTTYTKKYGACSTVTLAGSSLVKNGAPVRYDVIVNAGATTYPALAGLSSTAGIVCYRDDANNHYGTCNSLSYSAVPTSTPTAIPTNSPTPFPTRMPTASPTRYPTAHPTVVAQGEASLGRPHTVRVPRMAVEERFVLSADITVHWTATSGLDQAATTHSSDWIGLYKAGDCAQNRNVKTTDLDQNGCYIAYERVPGSRQQGTTMFPYAVYKWPAGRYEVRYFLGDSQHSNGMVCRDLDNSNGTAQHCALEAAVTSSMFAVVPWSPELVTRTSPGMTTTFW